MINNPKRRLRTALAFCLIPLLISCNLDQLPDLDNTYLPDYEGSLAILIVNDTITFGDFIEENIEDTSKYTITDEDRIIFSYSIEQDFEAGDDFVEIQNFNRFQSIPSPGASPIPFPKDTVITVQDTITFDFPTTKSEQVDSLYYSSGEFQLFMDSRYPFPVTYQFRTNSFLDVNTGNSISFTDDISPRSFSRQSQLLSGFKSILEPEDGENKFDVIVTAEITLQAGESLDGTEELIVQVGIVDPELDVIFGYFDKDTFDIAEERVDLGFFDDLGGEGIEFEAPSIEFNVSNSFGIPLSLDFSSVYAEYDDADTLSFNDGNGGPLLLEIETPAVDDWGSVQNSVVTIDKDNSNIREILRGSPNRLILPLAGYTNLGPVSGNFLASTSKIDIEAKVTIPLALKVEGFEYESTTKLDNLQDIEGTEQISLLISTVNELPFTGTVDLIMLDDNGDELASLPNQSIFEAPTSFDASGKVSAPSENVSTIDLNKELIDALINSAELKFVIKVNSPSTPEFVEIFADYDLQLKIGLAGDVSLDLNSN